MGSVICSPAESGTVTLWGRAGFKGGQTGHGLHNWGAFTKTVKNYYIKILFETDTLE